MARFCTSFMHKKKQAHAQSTRLHNYTWSKSAASQHRTADD